MTTAPSTPQVFRLPDLGEGLTEAEIVRWLVAVGDDVTVDQPLVEVETAKSAVEVPSPYAGRVTVLHGSSGQSIDVGSPLASIGQTIDNTVADAYREEEQAGSGNVLIGYGTPESDGRRRRRRRPPVRGHRPTLVVSPLVRRLARDGGAKLADIEPSGAGGIITRSDVIRALDVRPVPDSSERRTPLTGFRKAAASALARSRSEIPEATVWVDVDATGLWELRNSTRTADDSGPGLLAYVARFVVAGLKQYPVLNAHFDTERQEIVESERVHLGLAVQGERGLVAPAVMNADQLTTSQLDVAIRDVTARAREGKATPEELAAGTFTLNNYGSFRVDGSAAIINHPQVAILGLGRIIDRPWVVDGELCVRKVTQMSFVFDHRVCDGGDAAGFMRVVADAMENPAAAVRNL